MRSLLLAVSLVLAAAPVAAQASGGWSEAEDAELIGGTYVARSAPGFSGSGYVVGFTNSSREKVRFTFDAPAGLYRLTIRFATPSGPKGFGLNVAGVASSGMFPDTKGAFAEHDAGLFRLTGGPVSVVIAGGWGYYTIDAARLTPATTAPPTLPPGGLSDAQATPATRALFAYLQSEYGRHVLSGQQSMPDLQYIQQATGRTPAVGSFDLISYSPSRVERGDGHDVTMPQIVDWAGDRGIVSLCWHWNAPTDLLDTPGHEWWSGFYTHATTFDFQAALADPSSERYRLLLRDIDAIAVQLKALQDADVPVLWRPLHEAAGGWFWWGARGPEPFKQLWRLMHDRLTTVHGLHNLVWVFTTQGNDAAWYPGDDVVDIVGRDTYGEGSPAVNQRTEWAATQGEYGGRKMVALSEAGALHSPANSRDFSVWWSWFSVWSGDRIRAGKTPLADLQAVYADDLVITRDEMPDWRSRTVATAPSAALGEALALSVYPMPARGPVTARLQLREPSDAQLTVFDAVGRRVLTLPLGRLGAGEHHVPLETSRLSAGTYVVRLDAGAAHASVPLVVVR